MKKFWQNNSTPVLCTKLGGTAVLMFAFALFVMPPMYNLFCEVTGLNGKTGGRYTADANIEVDSDRLVTVQFIATNNENMPWDFHPTVSKIKVRPGEETVVFYKAKNPTDREMVAQAIPSLVPFKAANYFHKTECFCFNQQPLGAGESADLGLSFIVDKDIPKQVNTITLSYTLFDITESQQVVGKPSNQQFN